MISGDPPAMDPGDAPMMDSGDDQMMSPGDEQMMGPGEEQRMSPGDTPVGYGPGAARAFSAARAIIRKRDGHEHPPGEIERLIRGFVEGSVADYQMTAWMMAVFFRGMSREETARLTRAMIESGERLPAWGDGGAVVDKHSTGGTGDKVSLIVAPIAAACGLRVPMISGRALGHTGGTLDKLESIPGYRIRLSVDEFRDVVRRAGCSIAGASESIVPADRRMYALRDVSGIVEAPPLIVSSIISKKAAAGLQGLVLDVKAGGGGFISGLDDARVLARTLVDAASDQGMRTQALITRMDQPLGRAVGNAVEVEEAIRFLRGDPVPQDLEEVSIAIAAAMLRVGGSEEPEPALRGRLVKSVRSGRALDRLVRMIEAHGGDPRVADRPDLLPRPAARRTVRSDRDGWVARVDAREIGEILLDLGGGRRRAADSIDPSAGIVLGAKSGDRVRPGDPLCEILSGDPAGGSGLADRAANAFEIRAERPIDAPAVIQVVE